MWWVSIFLRNHSGSFGTMQFHSITGNKRKMWFMPHTFFHYKGPKCRTGLLQMVVFLYFSRMHSKGSCFTLGVWGLRCVRPTLRLRPQPFAAFSREGRMAVRMGSSAKGVAFEAFQRRVASFRMAGVALCDISNMFQDVSRVIICGRRNPLSSLSEDDLQFSWQLHVLCSFRGRRWFYHHGF